MSNYDYYFFFLISTAIDKKDRIKTLGENYGKVSTFNIRTKLEKLML